MNTALLYLTLAKPQFGSLLYMQNLTALNDYFLATESKPDGRALGGQPQAAITLTVSLCRREKRLSFLTRLCIGTRPCPKVMARSAHLVQSYSLASMHI